MQQSLETKLTVDECLALLHHTENAYEKFLVFRHGMTFTISRQNRLLKPLLWSTNIAENPTLEGVLVAQPFGTEIQVKFAKSYVNLFATLFPFLVSAGALAIVLLSLIFQESHPEWRPVCIGSFCVIPIAFVWGVLTVIEISNLEAREQSNLIKFVETTFQAKRRFTGFKIDAVGTLAR